MPGGIATPPPCLGFWIKKLTACSAAFSAWPLEYHYYTRKMLNLTSRKFLSYINIWEVTTIRFRSRSDKYLEIRLKQSLTANFKERTPKHMHDKLYKTAISNFQLCRFIVLVIKQTFVNSYKIQNYEKCKKNGIHKRELCVNYPYT